jgi:hypothetical protein
MSYRMLPIRFPQRMCFLSTHFCVANKSDQYEFFHCCKLSRLSCFGIKYAIWFVGERSKNQEDLLQEQGVQEAHTSQGYPIQEGEG